MSNERNQQKKQRSRRIRRLLIASMTIVTVLLTMNTIGIANILRFSVNHQAEYNEESKILNLIKNENSNANQLLIEERNMVLNYYESKSFEENINNYNEKLKESEENINLIKKEITNKEVQKKIENYIYIRKEWLEISKQIITIVQKIVK